MKWQKVKLDGMQTAVRQLDSDLKKDRAVRHDSYELIWNFGAKQLSESGGI